MSTRYNCVIAVVSFYTYWTLNMNIFFVPPHDLDIFIDCNYFGSKIPFYIVNLKGKITPDVFTRIALYATSVTEVDIDFTPSLYEDVALEEQPYYRRNLSVINNLLNQTTDTHELVIIIDIKDLDHSRCCKLMRLLADITMIYIFNVADFQGEISESRYLTFDEYLYELQQDYIF